MSTPPRQIDPPLLEPELEPGASDLLKGLAKGSRSPEPAPADAPASAEETPEDPEAIGRTTTEYDGAGDTSSPIESDASEPALDLPVTRPEARSATSSAELVVARRETRKLELSDIEPTRPNIVGFEPTARRDREPEPEECEPPTGKELTPTVPAPFPPGGSGPTPAQRDRSEATLAIAKRETARLPLSDVEPTRPAAVVPELVRASATIETAVAASAAPALVQSFEDDESDFDLTRPAGLGPERSSQPMAAPADSPAPTPIAKPIGLEAPEPVTPEPVTPEPVTPEPVTPEPEAAEPNVPARPARSPVASPAPVASPQPPAAPSRPPEHADAPDPDATGKLDGLPPFALLERIGSFGRDPDSTNRFVKPASLDDVEPAHAPAPSSAGPALPPVAPSPGSSRPEPTIVPSRPAPDASDAARAPAPGRRQVSLAMFLAFNALTLVLGFVSGALLLILAVRYDLALPFEVGRGPAATSPGVAEARLDPPPALPRVGPAADAGVGAALPAASDAAPPPAAEASPSWTVLPDALVVPVEYRPGRAQPEAPDQDALRRIAEAFAASPDLRVELVGHATPLDAVTGDAAETLALRRAESALEQLRSHGPSRRRFFTRVARDDEPMLEPDATPAGLLRAVDLRVVQR